MRCDFGGLGRRNADLDRELRADVELEEEQQRENGLSSLSQEGARFAPPARLREPGPSGTWTFGSLDLREPGGADPGPDARGLGRGALRATLAGLSVGLAAVGPFSRSLRGGDRDSGVRYRRVAGFAGGAAQSIGHVTRAIEAPDASNEKGMVPPRLLRPEQSCIWQKIGGEDLILAATGFWLQPYFALCLIRSDAACALFDCPGFSRGRGAGDESGAKSLRNHALWARTGGR